MAISCPDSEMPAIGYSERAKGCRNLRSAEPLARIQPLLLGSVDNPLLALIVSDLAID